MNFGIKLERDSTQDYDIYQVLKS